MCRHLAYLGPPCTVASLVLDPPHSLEHQSYAPRLMEGGAHVNVDGFGAGWYPDPDGPALRYRRNVPIWQDRTFHGLAPTFRSHAVLAALRGATPGMGGGEEACAPFSDGRLLFSLNGFVDGWPDTVPRLAATLSTTELLTLDATTDAAFLWAVLGAGLREGVDTGQAVAALAASVVASAPASRCNLLLTDGRRLWATRYRHSLFVLRAEGALTVASEPLDDRPGWREVPDGHVLHGDPDRVELDPIGPLPPGATGANPGAGR